MMDVWDKSRDHLPQQRRVMVENPYARNQNQNNANPYNRPPQYQTHQAPYTTPRTYGPPVMMPPYYHAHYATPLQQSRASPYHIQQMTNSVASHYSASKDWSNSQSDDHGGNQYELASEMYEMLDFSTAPPGYDTSDIVGFPYEDGRYVGCNIRLWPVRGADPLNPNKHKYAGQIFRIKFAKTPPPMQSFNTPAYAHTLEKENVAPKKKPPLSTAPKKPPVGSGEKKKQTESAVKKHPASSSKKKTTLAPAINCQLRS
eukprot:scaffold64961_cov46-Cyclotella_meneghiniana.AAC.1